VASSHFVKCNDACLSVRSLCLSLHSLSLNEYVFLSKCITVLSIFWYLNGILLLAVAAVLVQKQSFRIIGERCAHAGKVACISFCTKQTIKKGRHKKRCARTALTLCKIIAVVRFRRLLCSSCRRCSSV
jgi:hypothetical protein